MSFVFIQWVSLPLPWISQFASRHRLWTTRTLFQGKSVIFITSKYAHYASCSQLISGLLDQCDYAMFSHVDVQPLGTRLQILVGYACNLDPDGIQYSFVVRGQFQEHLSYANFRNSSTAYVTEIHRIRSLTLRYQYYNINILLIQSSNNKNI